MGVKTHYLLQSGASLYLGPTAYYKLEATYKLLSERYHNTTRLILPKGGWRKKIDPLYKELRKLFGAAGAGELKILKTRNPDKNAHYRDYTAYVRAHPKPQTPPTRGTNDGF